MNNKTEKYEALKIPARQSGLKSGVVEPFSRDAAQTESSPADGVYYEIEYDTGPIPGVGKFVLKPQTVPKPENDETRERFARMREIARTQRSAYDYAKFFDRGVQKDIAVVFYRQGMFMKDFTDDYEGDAPFSRYFPCYQMMGYEQLRTYFSWRTQVRQGRVCDTSVSYAFLYIYELLANIGVTDEQDGLKKLMSFWRAFREHNHTVDNYVLRWLKEYHIYYDLPHSFKEFVSKNDLAEHFPHVAETDNDFELFCAISKYNIKKSAFFTDETSKSIAACFAFVMDTIRRDFDAAGMDFDDALFRPTRRLVAWKPFKDALFYSPDKRPDKQVVLSGNEIYICENNEWKFSTIITTENGRQFIGYVMKQTESVLRKLYKYRYALTADVSSISEETVRKLIKAGLHIEKIVPAAVLAYHREATKTVVTVDRASLARIREEALKTQESLIVEEQQSLIKPAFLPPQVSAWDRHMFADAMSDTADEPSPASGMWEEFKDRLSEHEVRALEVVLCGSDLKAFADECAVMTEVLIDAINEKAMDCIGDNLMDDEFSIYDDYKEQVKDLIK